MTTLSNPVLPGFYPDPSVCRVGDDYYLVTSSFEYFPGVPIFHSRDLVHWRQIGHALTRASQLPLAGQKSSKGIFAPTIRFHAGTFYVVTTNIENGGSFYVTATDPAGEWSEPTWLNEKEFSMDPSLFFDDDGKVYFTRHGGGRHGGVYQHEIDLATGTLSPAQPRLVWQGTGDIWPEGPHLYKNDGTYYLMISEGGTSYEHMITVARSTSPWGPFEPHPHNPIFTHRYLPEHSIQATGHGDLVQAPDGRWWIVFLGIRPSVGKFHHLGRETFLAPVTWQDGWPIVNGGRPVDETMQVAGLPQAHPWPDVPARSDFDTASLSFEWNYLRNPDAARYSLTERSGHLRLRGVRASLDDVASPTFVGRRQTAYDSVASTRLDFTPLGDDEEAGLVVRSNEENHYDLLVVRRGATRRAVLRTTTQGVRAVVAERDLPSGPVTLTVRSSRADYSFSFTADGGAEVALGSAAAKPFSSEISQGFTGAYFGLYAYASDAAAATPADFDWFEYVASSP